MRRYYSERELVKCKLIILLFLLALMAALILPSLFCYEHLWDDATCTAPKTCVRCDETEGKALGHVWSVGSENPRVCERCGAKEPLDLPKNGQVFVGAGLNRESELKIKSKTSKSCYVKLKNAAGTDVFAFFVRAGSTVTISVPKGNYYVYFAYGDEWYGTEDVFGPDTTYAKDDELLDFSEYTWEYTLEPVKNGNFSATPIDAEEFK